jgi:hypothetical protein
MASKDNMGSDQDATLAQLESAGTELDLFRLSGDIDEVLLDASLDEYQYGTCLPQPCYLC